MVKRDLQNNTVIIRLEKTFSRQNIEKVCIIKED